VIAVATNGMPIITHRNCAAPDFNGLLPTQARRGPPDITWLPRRLFQKALQFWRALSEDL
jgi:hypothetical protein